jgi:hypothetical protein
MNFWPFKKKAAVSEAPIQNDAAPSTYPLSDAERWNEFFGGGQTYAGRWSTGHGEEGFGPFSPACASFPQPWLRRLRSTAARATSGRRENTPWPDAAHPAKTTS